MHIREKLAVSVPEACRLLGLGRTSLYMLIRRRDLQVVKVGRRTLVALEDLRELVARLRVDR